MSARMDRLKVACLACLWVFLSVGCLAVHYPRSSRIRGARFERPRQQRPLRMLQMMDEDQTPEPSQEPSVAPSAVPSGRPSTGSKSKPSSTDVDVPPTALPSSATLEEPTLVPSQPANAPSAEPTSSPPVPRPPSVSPTLASSTNPPTADPTAAPSSPTALPAVPLADFGIEYVANDDQQDSIQQVTQDYLFQTLKTQYDTLAAVQLAPIATPTTRRHARRLQEQSWTTLFAGNATFEANANTQPLPSEQQVQATQTTALKDTEFLQASLDQANVDVVVQQVVVQDNDNGGNGGNDNGSTTNETNVGLLVGVSIAGAIILALAAFVVYKQFKHVSANAPAGSASSSKNEKDKSRSYSDISTPNNNKARGGGDFAKYTPDDFEQGPTRTHSMPTEDEEDSSNQDDGAGGDESVEVPLDMDDEYSLSAASADSSIAKQNPEQRRASLLKKLALYQRSSSKGKGQSSQTQEQGGGGVPMPATFFVPQVVDRDDRETSQLSISSFDLAPDSLTSAVVQSSSTSNARAISLLDQSGSRDDDDDDDDISEQDLLPPPPPPLQQALVASPDGKSQWALSFSPTPSEATNEETELQIVPKAHDFPSTTWAHYVPGSTARTYSDGPSDEMNAALEQDLTNFQLALVSPDQSPLQDARPVRPIPASPPQANQEMQLAPSVAPPPPSNYSSRAARSTERNSTSITRPPRKRSSSSASRQRGMNSRAVSPPTPDTTPPRRARSSSSRRRRSASEDERSYGSYSSYASNGSEAMEDLNSLSAFLRERRLAKQQQRRDRSQQRNATRG